MKPTAAARLATLLFFPIFGTAQTATPPCHLQATMDLGICLDLPCLVYEPKMTSGTPPFSYLWQDGSTGERLRADPPDFLEGTCVEVLVTDALGCRTLLALPGGTSSQSFLPVDFVRDDSLFLPTGSASDFDLRANDSPAAQNFEIIQPPQHGQIQFNADGTGKYTPDPNWCGPDNFRYTARDADGCRAARLATVVIQPSPCAGIFFTKKVCNSTCSAAAFFYQSGVFAPPLDLKWSNGETGTTATGLCAGQVSLTVSDAVGKTQTFTASPETADFSVEIAAPDAVCSNVRLRLEPLVGGAAGGGDLLFDWTGYGIFNSIKSDSLLNFYPSFPNVADTVEYQLIAISPLGCADTATAAVRVLPSPTFSFPSYLKLNCPADTLRLAPTGLTKGTPPYFFAWSGPAGAQSNWSEFVLPDAQPSNSGTYFLTVSDVNGCSARRDLDVTVPDSCTFKLIIWGAGGSNCSGGEHKFDFGTTPSGGTPDEVEWRGPNGFFSKNLNPILKNTDPSMTGWYHLKARYGKSVLTADSVFLEISSQIFTVENVEITTPPTCSLPYQGKVVLTMSEPPPYEYVSSNWGGSASPSFNPITFSGVPVAAERIVSVKKNGCWAKKYVFVPAPQPPVFQIENETCAGGDGKISVASPNPLSVFWTLPNGSTLSNQPVLNPAPAGLYKIEAKDLTTNCKFKQVAEVKPYLDFTVAAVDTPACTAADGSLVATTLGSPVPPVAFEWSNGFAGNPATGLAAGGYSVTMSDGDGCRRHQNTVLPADEACIALVGGRVFANLDCSCQPSAANLMFPTVRVCASRGSFSTCAFADNFGKYQLALTEAGDYELEATTWLPNAQPACTTKTITLLDAATDLSDIDFYFCGEEKADLRAAVFCGVARPGFDQNSSVEVQNVGFWKADTSILTVRFSPFLSVSQLSPPPASFDLTANEATWIIPKLAIFEKFKLKIVGKVLANLGDTMALQAKIKSLKTPDDFPTNDSDDCETIAVGSFDPNDKQVEPLGAISTAADSVLTYTIRFQNTGTDTAFAVVIRDTLDRSVFDPSTVEPLLSSHPFRLDLDEGHILVFKFDPILLPDSNRNRAGSEGFVSFRVRLKKGLPALTPIRNSAAIYFDFNEPVITNFTQNQISKTAVPTADLRPILSLAPNPAQGDCRATIRLPEQVAWLVLSLENPGGGSSRRLAFFEKPQPEEQVRLDLAGLPAGVYFVRAATDRGLAVEKLVVLGK